MRISLICEGIPKLKVYPKVVTGLISFKQALSEDAESWPPQAQSHTNASIYLNPSFNKKKWYVLKFCIVPSMSFLVF